MPSSRPYKRIAYDSIASRLAQPRRWIQVLSGPRQTGKTTLARQVMQECGLPFHYAAADEPLLRSRTWLQQQWDSARLSLRSAKEPKKGFLLVLDEVQKIEGWAETVKHLWDEDSASDLPVKVLLLGSSPLLLQRGLGESLAGRFELFPLMHWSYREMQQAFGYSLEQYLYFGGYPGAASLLDDAERWAAYIRNSLLETTLSRDILLMARVDKPALLRHLLQLGCAYSGQILSYQKMLGQLHDAGNTTTLAHYLELLSGAGLLTGLAKYSCKQLRLRASSPKLQVLNTALMNVFSPYSLLQAQQNREFWGRLVESAVGAHLFNTSRGSRLEVLYWRERQEEVDFILQTGDDLVAIEVKSGRRREAGPGLGTLARRYPVKRQLLVGGSGIALEDFLSHPAGDWAR